MKYYIDSQVILGRKIEPLIYVYIMIIIIIVLSLIIFMMLFHYKTYYNIRGIIDGEDYYIRLYVPLDDAPYVINGKIVRINRKDYEYEIVKIDDEYLSDNYNTYQVVFIKINLPSKYKFNNLSLSIQFLKDDKRVIDYIIRR